MAQRVITICIVGVRKTGGFAISASWSCQLVRFFFIFLFFFETIRYEYGPKVRSKSPKRKQKYGPKVRSKSTVKKYVPKVRSKSTVQSTVQSTVKKSKKIKK